MSNNKQDKIAAHLTGQTTSASKVLANHEHKGNNPIIILLGILLFAAALTYLVDAGEFARDGNLVVPGSFQKIEKSNSLTNVWRLSDDPDIAQPASLAQVAMAIPQGLERGANLIFMVLIIGGMFGILTKAGAITAGLERLLGAVRGNVYLLVPSLMIVFAAGSTFLGLASEYLLIIPLMVEMARRLGLSNLMGLAILTVPVKAGFLASVTNPVALTVAQPLVDVPIFSGISMRLFAFVVFTLVGIIFIMLMIKREGFDPTAKIEFDSSRLSGRHTLMLSILCVGIAMLVYGSTTFEWHNQQLTAFYIALAVVIACISGLGANGAADAFVEGMRKILLAAILIGVAFAIAVTLQNGQILDTVIYQLTSIVGEDNPILAVQGMFISQLLLDFLIPSTSGQAAVSMPILGPIGQLVGVSPHTTVLAFLFGNGITTIFTPTSGTLLAYLATAQVAWTTWARFVLPLVGIYIVLAVAMLAMAVLIGY
ncbi:YfcC family protein [Alkalimonas collagenimarina]|uniref:YfcC family protein n=1 Tax=Alkalimonas collagenimarina TaxID=400390 RepID=A0ABT9H007_9GAMM|nr:YfcC family protein [Alkalimonas collagenimarina]MDP4536643.1 YfcC family protein [Alkalimonas collagenimarina]